MLLELHDVKVTYGRIEALHGISLHVNEGEIVTLIGANGAGKTTVLRAVTGLLALHDGDITKGRITLDDTRLDGQPPERVVRAGVAQVMEGRRIFAALTVEENLVAGTVAARGDMRARIDGMYQRFPRLAERRRQTAGLLSGGEQQMLAIARALLARPRVLLLDEPSLGLAPIIVQQLFATIRSIRERGTTVLLVEQNANISLSVADREIGRAHV